MAEATGIWLIDGEDAGASDPWEWSDVVDGGTATFVLSDAAEAHGTYGYRVTGDGATNACYGKKTFTTASNLYFRCYVKLQTGLCGVGDWHNMFMFQLLNSDNIIFSFGTLTNGIGSPYPVIRWTCYGAGSGLPNTEPTTNFSLGAWHYVEIQAKRDVDGGAGGVKVWVDGDSAYDDMDQNWDYQVNNLRLGIGNVAIADDHVIDFDDIKCDDEAIGIYSDAGGGTIVPLLMNYYRRLRT